MSPRTLYRTLLRELHTPPLLPKSPLQATLRSAFSPPPSTSTSTSTLTTSPSPSPPSSIEQMHQLATYLRAQRSYASLLERYNPSLGSGGGDSTERVERSARAVGLSLPSTSSSSSSSSSS